MLRLRTFSFAFSHVMCISIVVVCVLCVFSNLCVCSAGCSGIRGGTQEFQYGIFSRYDLRHVVFFYMTCLFSFYSFACHRCNDNERHRTREQSTSGVFLLLCSVRSFVRERLLCIAFLRFRSFRFFFLLSMFLCLACSADYSADEDRKQVKTELGSQVNQVNGFLYVTSGLKNF